MNIYVNIRIKGLIMNFIGKHQDKGTIHEHICKHQDKGTNHELYR